MKKIESLGRSLSRQEQKMILGGDDPIGTIGDGTSCSADCPSGQKAEITDCNGTCTGYKGYAECVGAHNTLKKTCA